MMVKKSISWMLLVALVNYLVVGCNKTSQYKLLPEEFGTSIAAEKITGVVTSKGKRYEFLKYGNYVDVPYMIKGYLADGQLYSVALEHSGLNEIRTSHVESIPVNQASGKSIKEIILKNFRGGEVPWQNVRWDYDFTTNVLTGRNDSGILFEADADSIREIRLTTPDTISIANLIKNPDTPVFEVKVGARIYIFDAFGARLVQNHRVISGILKNNEHMEIPLHEVLYVMVERVDPTKTFFAFMGGLVLVLGIAFLIAAAAKQSCPFVYSFDGEKYIFDAEPLGGAVAKGLQKVDYSRLEQLKPVDGRYTLIFRNEVRETQFLDQIKLLTIDHDPGSVIVPDIEGHFYQVSQPLAAYKYYDEQGDSLDLFLSENDGLVWQTYMPRGIDSSFRQERHEIIMEFPRPEGVKTANLIFNGGTALWGSNMIREMLELRGDKLHEWYSGINSHGAKYMDLVHFTLREELYVLNLFARDGENWRHLNYIGGGGPLITEDRIIPMDLSWFNEDTLTLRITPPPGFWQIDYIAVEYSKTTVSEINEISFSEAIDAQDKNISAGLMLADEAYHEMPKVGDWFKVQFPAPDYVDGKQRSIFLETNGYYELHIDTTKSEQTALIREILDTPGKIIEYSKKRYFEWTKEQLSSGQVP